MDTIDNTDQRAHPSDSLFRHGKSVETLRIRELLKWRLDGGSGRLLLPPIQRSLVWSNAQIINYWDSLLRGYPPGMMMVHRSRPTQAGAEPQGRDEGGKTQAASDSDWQLFDGQQRLASILLGLGKGEWHTNRKLWIDLGADPDPASGLKFQLRASSTGQPFGYSTTAPNQKIELSRRMEAWRKWREEGHDRRAAFEQAQGGDILGAQCAVSLAQVCKLACEEADVTSAIVALGELPGTEPARVEAFVQALYRTFDSEIVVRLVDEQIVSDPDEYVRFFGRVGQGGTALSNNELTYSMIKYKYPGIHDRMQDIKRSEAGKLAGEVDLVLGALRVSKTLAPAPEKKEWEILSRPTPPFVSEIGNWIEAERRFLSLIPPAVDGLDPSAPSGELEQVLVSLRRTLAYGRENLNGLPSILLARLPRQLLDVLVLFALKADGHRLWDKSDRTALGAFTLHWLLFVGDDDKASLLAFQHALDPAWAFSANNARHLIAEFEREGSARFMPRADALEKLRKGLNDQLGREGKLRAWAERFTAADQGDAHKPGEAIRMLSSHGELIRRALIWLQREYITEEFPDYDPTSGRDEDLPIDLDHIIPHALFGYDWRLQDKRLDKGVGKENFRANRHTIGNSLGNYRWLSASENRSRQAKPMDGGQADVTSREIAEMRDEFDLVSNREDWNVLIQKSSLSWSAGDVATFQLLIDTRTLNLYEHLLAMISSVLPE